MTLNGTEAATAVNINSGVLNLGNNNRLADAATVTVAGGSLGMSTFNDTVGTFNMSAGSLDGSGTLTATTYGLSGGTVNANLGNGTINVATGNVTLNGTEAATAVNINSGALNLGNNNRLADGATVTVAGGSLGMGTFNDTVATFNMSAGSLDGSGTLTATTYGLSGGTVNAQLGGTAPITKNTPGTVTITSGSTYAGNTTISAGTILVNNTSGSATGTGEVTVTGSGTLGGSGIISGNITASSGGTVSPGDSPGKLIAGGGDFSAGGNLLIQVGGYNAPVSPYTDPDAYDRLDLGNGTLTVGGTSTLTVDLAGLSTNGTAYGVVLYGSHVGTPTAQFATLNVINNTVHSYVVTPIYGATSLDLQIISYEAPTLTANATVTLPGANVGSASPGTLVSSILTSAGYSDTNGIGQSGMAVTATTGNGTWQYSTDGTTWTGFGTVTDSASLLLASTTQVRFQPSGSSIQTATFTFRGWNQTSGTASVNGAPHTADTTSNGGPTAFSSETATGSLAVAFPSSTAVSPSADPSTFGKSVTFTATVTSSYGTPTGTVTFMDGASSLAAPTLASGKASFTPSTLAAGNHTITVIYGGDANFNTSTSIPLTQVVNLASTTTTIASSSNPSTYGQTVTFTATVNSRRARCPER